MSLTYWMAILLAGGLGSAMALYFAWPDVSKTADDDKKVN